MCHASHARRTRHAVSLSPDARSPAAQYDYSAALRASYQFYDAMRVGTLPVNATPAWRASALTYEADPYGTLQGGFVAGAGSGVIKLSLPIAYSTSMLAWSAVQYAQARFPLSSINQLLQQQHRTQLSAHALLHLMPSPGSDAPAAVGQAHLL